MARREIRNDPGLLGAVVSDTPPGTDCPILAIGLGPDICLSCGYDYPCGCPMDVNTMAKMQCPSCGGQWWRSWGDDSTRCLHRTCGAEGSVVREPPRYAPHGEDECSSE